MSFEHVANVWCDGEGYPYPGGAADYEREMRGLLDLVSGTVTGRTLLGFFSLRSRRITIVPMNRNQQGNNAIQSPGPGQVSALGGGGPGDAENRFRRGAVLHDPRGVARPDLPRGTGRGVDGFVYFTPLHFAARPEAPRDAVLVHELFHAMRAQFGMTENRPLGEDFHTIEELFAIFVENMHRLERGYDIRANHKRQQHVSPDHSMAANPRFHEPMRRLNDMMPTIVNAFGRIDIAYNPFRDWLSYRRAHPEAGLARAG